MFFVNPKKHWFRPKSRQRNQVIFEDNEGIKANILCRPNWKFTFNPLQNQNEIGVIYDDDA